VKILEEKAKAASKTLERGIRQDAFGVQAYVYVHGHTRAKRFKLGTPITEVRAWRENQRVGARLGIAVDAKAITFEDDAETYLSLVKAMPTYTDREYRIKQWVDAFAGRTRASLRSSDIRAQLERWRIGGRHDGKGLSPASLNTRRTALMHLFTVLDGKSAANPVRDVPPYPEESGDVIRAQPWRVLYRLLARLRKGSKTRARLRVMLWTGLPHAQIMRVQPTDLDVKGKRLRVSRRRKGKGHPAKWLPLLPPAVTAWQAFAKAGAWGKFSQSAMHSALARAVEDENVWRRKRKRPLLPRVRPYDFRHSAGSLFASLTHDERVVQELLLSRQRRYTEGATDARVERAVREMAQKAI